MKTNYFLLLFLILAFSACKKDDSSEMWSISGEVQMQDAQNPIMTTPLSGINVYLLKLPFTMDTLTDWFTKTDILDSTLTDANGFYKYSQLRPGDYIVMATDTSAGYRFDWSESPDPIGVLSDNTKKVFTMNFTTPEPIIENSDDVYKFVFNNSGAVQYIALAIYRTKRNYGYLGWDWGPVFGWGNWYWEQVDHSGYNQGLLFKSSSLKDILMNELFEFEIKKDNNWFWWEYTNEFHLKFYNRIAADSSPFWIKTISVDDLKDVNIYDLNWQVLTVDVTRKN